MGTKGFALKQAIVPTPWLEIDLVPADFSLRHLDLDLSAAANPNAASPRSCARSATDTTPSSSIVRPASPWRTRARSEHRTSCSFPSSRRHCRCAPSSSSAPTCKPTGDCAIFGATSGDECSPPASGVPAPSTPRFRSWPSEPMRWMIRALLGRDHRGRCAFDPPGASRPVRQYPTSRERDAAHADHRVTVGCTATHARGARGCRSPRPDQPRGCWLRCSSPASSARSTPGPIWVSSGGARSQPWGGRGPSQGSRSKCRRPPRTVRFARDLGQMTQALSILGRVRAHDFHLCRTIRGRRSSISSQNAIRSGAHRDRHRVRVVGDSRGRSDNSLLTPVTHGGGGREFRIGRAYVVAAHHDWFVWAVDICRGIQRRRRPIRRGNNDAWSRCHGSVSRGLVVLVPRDRNER